MCFAFTRYTLLLHRLFPLAVFSAITKAVAVSKQVIVMFLRSLFALFFALSDVFFHCHSISVSMYRSLYDATT